MGEFTKALEQANSSFRTADHLAYVSYPLLRDNRLLLAITQNLYIAGLKTVDAVLYYEKMHKRITIMPIDFESRMLLFEKQLAPKINIQPGAAKIIRDLKFIMQQHRETSMEFSRKEKFIICSDDYTNMKTIDIEMLKSYIVVLRDFLHKINRLDKDV